MGLASLPVAELTNLDITTMDTAAKDIAEKADIAIGAKVRMSKNVIAKNGIEPLKRAIAACEKAGTGGPDGYLVMVAHDLGERPIE